MSADPQSDQAKPDDSSGKVSALASLLRETEQELNRVAAGEVDSLVLGDGKVFLLRQAQGDLLASEARFRQLFEASPDPIFVEDLEGMILDVNEAGCQLHMLTREEIVGKCFTDLIPPDERESARREFDELALLARGKTNGFSMRSDGRSVPVEVRTSRIEGGGRAAILLHIRDVTERAEALKAIVESEQFARGALDALVANIAILDAKGVIVRVNKAWAAFAESNPPSLAAIPAGENYLEFCEASEGPATEGDRHFAAGIRSVLEGTLDVHFQEHECHIAQDTRWFQGRVSRFPGGGPRRIVVSQSEITERKRMQRQNEEQANLLDHASDAIVVRDLKRRIIYWNMGAEKIYGWKASEVIGRPPPDSMIRDPAAFAAAHDAVMANGEWAGEFQQRTKEGREIVVSARWTLIRDDKGEPRSVLVINTDITEKKRLESQFLRAQRIESIGNLASGVAHDLNNILAPILMSVTLLQMKVAESDEDSRKLLGTLEASAQRGAHLVRQVLGFGRGYEGERVDVHPGQVAREVANIVKDTFPKAIAVDCEVDREAWNVTGDPTQLHQILLNLCVNARDAMPKGGNLSLRVSNVMVDEVFAGMHLDAKTGPYVMMSVKDTGMGIPRGIQERMFEPFFTTKERGKGTGLGLSTVHGLVKSHAGFILLESYEGIGTTFKVYLPGKTSSGGAEAGAPTDTELPRGKNELILLVDDEEPIRIVAQKTLERFGYRVLPADNGAHAVSLYALHRDDVAVVITDMAMPVMDGPATIRALRSINPRIKVIGSSGMGSYAGKGLVEHSAQMDFFLSKPYVASVLLRTLRKVIESGSRPPMPIKA